MTTTTVTESQTLYFRQGSSDKQYSAAIAPQGDGYVVTFSYGRRGATQTTGTKTKTPTTYTAAKAIFDKLIAEKLSKGYTLGEDGTPHQSGDKTVSGLLPQLLNTVEDGAVRQLLDDPAWCLQEKFDGRRMMLRKVGPTVEAINKLGLIAGVSTAVASAVAGLPGDAVLDGEVIGDRFYAFDILSCGGVDLTGLPYRERYTAMTLLLVGADSALAVVPSWWDALDKAEQLEALRARNAEGVVFKHIEAPYTVGRPNSGGNQRKHKFVATCSAVVSVVNQQRSVAVSLLDGDQWRPVGNVTIPTNHSVPSVGEVVEVRYLYALDGGSLYQPVYLGVRDDIESHECVVGQLKLKAV